MVYTKKPYQGMANSFKKRQVRQVVPVVRAPAGRSSYSTGASSLLHIAEASAVEVVEGILVLGRGGFSR